MELLTNQSYSDFHIIPANIPNYYLSIYYYTGPSQEFTLSGSKTPLI